MKILKILLPLFFILFTVNVLYAQEADTDSNEQVTNKLEILEETQKIRFQSLEREIDNLREQINRELDQKSEAYNSRLNLYLSFVIGIIAILSFLITFFGRKTISSWIKSYSEEKVLEMIEQKISELNLEDTIKNKSDQLVNDLIEEVENKVNKHSSELDNLKQEYITELSKFSESEVETEVKELDGDSEETSIESKDAEELIEKPSASFMNLYYKGLREHEKSNHLRAKNYWEEANKINPDSYMILTNLGFSYKHLGNYEKAKEYFENARKIEPDSYHTYIGLGNVYSDLNLNDKAVEEYSKAIDLNPSHFSGYHNRGLAYQANGDTEKALSDYAKASELNPTYGWTYYKQGQIYKEKKNYKKALDMYSKAIEVDPVEIKFISSRAYLNYQENNYKEALQDYKRVVELDSNDTSAKLNMSELYIMLHDYDNSYNYLTNIDDKQLDNSKTLVKYILLFVTELVKGEKTQKTSAKLNDLISQKHSTGWNFSEIIEWMDTVEIDEEISAKINQMIFRIESATKPYNKAH